MILTIVGLSVLLVLMIIEREYLLKKNKELTEICEMVFENEQKLMNQLEETVSKLEKNSR